MEVCKCLDCGKEWKPKSFNKSVDDELDVKSYCGFDINKQFPFMEEYAESKEYKDLITKYLSDLSKQKINIIIKILKESLKENTSIRSIAKKIDVAIKDMDRSLNIARTETIRIANEGNIKRIQEKGGKKVEWISSPEDGRRCEECADRDKKIYDINSVKGKIPLHPKCRCSTAEYYEISQRS